MLKSTNEFPNLQKTNPINFQQFKFFTQGLGYYMPRAMYIVRNTCMPCPYFTNFTSCLDVEFQRLSQHRDVRRPILLSTFDLSIDRVHLAVHFFMNAPGNGLNATVRDCRRVDRESSSPYRLNLSFLKNSGDSFVNILKLQSAFGMVSVRLV